jgi:hypothetical protein
VTCKSILGIAGRKILNKLITNRKHTKLSGEPPTGEVETRDTATETCSSFLTLP